MLEIKKSVFGICAILGLTTGICVAQSTCDTTPDPGQTVGRCLLVTTSQGDLATCNVTNPEGETWYFGKLEVGG